MPDYQRSTALIVPDYQRSTGLDGAGLSEVYCIITKQRPSSQAVTPNVNLTGLSAGVSAHQMRPVIRRDVTLGTDKTGGQNKGINETYIHLNRYKYSYSFLA